MAFAADQFSPHPDWGRADAEPDVLPIPADPDIADLAARSEAKDQVTREVLAGRMTLLEAAARFARLNATPPYALVPPPDILARGVGLPDPGDCGEVEWQALQVVVRAVSIARRESPERAEEVTEKLRCQFVEDRSAGRLARLPDVTEDGVDKLLGRQATE
jgi:hypothetical protein